jgi:hypothetical protein
MRYTVKAWPELHESVSGPEIYRGISLFQAIMHAVRAILRYADRVDFEVRR